MTDPEAITKAVVMLDALAERIRDQANELRSDLNSYAQTEYQRTRAGVTWRYQGLANVVLPLTKQAAYVDDAAALLDWVKRSQPDQVETTEQVRQAFIKYLLGAVVCEHDAAYLDGEEVPGLAVRLGGRPKPVAVTPSAEAKALFRDLAGEALRQLAAGPLAPVLALPAGDET